MLPLTLEKRTVLLRISAVTCAGSLLLMPVAGYSSGSPPELEAYATPFAVPTVAPHRPDRFAPTVRDPFRSPTEVESFAPVRATLKAFVDGLRPIALVGVGGTVLSIAAGVPAFGSRVISVSRTSIRLADGRVLELGIDAP